MNPPWSLQSASAAFARCWNDFFHQPGDARLYALVRIVFATLVLIHFAVLYPDLDHWFTADGVLPRETSWDAVSAHSWSLLSLFPDTSAAVHLAFWAAIASTIALLVGLFPRINALLVFLWIVSFQVRNDIILDGEDTLLRILAFFVIWLPSGQAWSVGWDQLAQRAPAHRFEVPGWPLRLLQFQMAAMFLSSGLMKLAGDDWFNGTALYYVSRLDDHFGRFWVPAFVFDTPWIVALLTWSVLIAELAIPFFIWFRETRIPCLVIVVFFHLANEWTMNLFLFHWLMLCGWLAFVPPGFLARLTTKQYKPEAQARDSAAADVS
jgi:hypothetical protein